MTTATPLISAQPLTSQAHLTTSWMTLTGVRREAVEVQIGNGKITLEAVIKGNLSTATKVYHFIPGFATTAHCFGPSFGQFDPTTHPTTALVSLSIIGGLSSVDSSVELGPEQMTEAWTQGLLQLIPNPKKTHVTHIGNSLGGVLGLAVALLYAELTNTSCDFIADDPMTPDIVGKLTGPFWGEANAWLHRLMCVGQRYLPAVALKYVFRGLFKIPFVIRWLTQTLYNNPTQEQYEYYQDLFLKTQTEEGKYPIADVLSQIAAPIDQWWKYLETRFPSKVTRTQKGERRVQLSGKALVAQSTSDRVFDKQNALRFWLPLRQNNGDEARFRTTEGPHLETTPRALELARE